MGKEIINRMNYLQTVDFLFSQLPLFQRTGPAAYKANLNNTLSLDEHFGHPHRSFKSVHVAGTNGKGSVSHSIASVLQNAGYKTGLFTSPHLVDFRERIKINGVMVPEEYVTNFVNDNIGFIRKTSPSFFELTTLMAFRYFADSKAEIVVVETGMGGRLDSTNIITPLVSVITNIGLDHTQFLGHTLAEIAAEKAGIIKSGIPVVIGEWQKETEEVFTTHCIRMNAPFQGFASLKYKVHASFLSSDRKQIMHIEGSENGESMEVSLDLLGLYQRKNLPTVLLTIESLKKSGIKITEDAVYRGLRDVTKITGLRGRWEEIGHNPLIICDTGHNAEGIVQVVEQISQTPHKELHFIFGMVNDKDSSRVLALLPKDAHYYFSRADIPRALDPQILKKQAEAFGLNGQAFHEIKKAFVAAKGSANAEDLIFIGGSTFVVAELFKQFPEGFSSNT